MVHSFISTDFASLTYCDQCQGLLWGLVKQGLKCSDCDAVCHFGCQKEFKKKCKNNIVLDTKSSYDSPAAKSLRSLQQQHTIPDISSSSGSSFAKLKQLATSEEFQNVLVSAAIHSNDTSLPHDYLTSMPPLNAQNTAKNFSRFVSRCGPMFTFKDNLVLLLGWDKPIDTATALLVYCLICLHPKLLFFVPHIILIQIILSGYSKKQTKKTSGFFQSFFPAEDSPEYLKNMQNLQNMMGEMSDLYDAIAAQSHYVDWSSETETMRVFQALLVSFVLLSIVVYVVPMNLVFLVGGIFMFLLNTRFAKFVMKEMLPQLNEIGQAQIESVLNWYNQMEKKLEDQVNIKEMSLFENQRWWSSSGFMPHTLPNERGLWTNMSGTVELAPREELSAPEGYHWIEDNWTLDETGPWIDDVLNLEIMVTPETGGWVYTDDNWENPRNSNVVDVSDNKTVKPKSVTRRRRWVRKCEINTNEEKK